VAIVDTSSEVREQRRAIAPRERAVAADLADGLLHEHLRHRADARGERLGTGRQEGRARRVGDTDIRAPDSRSRTDRGAAAAADPGPTEADLGELRPARLRHRLP